MKSQVAQSPLTDRRNNRVVLRNKLNALSKIDMGVSSESLDEFFKGVFKSLGLNIDSSYKISQIISILEDRGIKITAIRGIPYPGDITDAVKGYMDRENTFARNVLKNILFSGNTEDKENFDRIIECFDDEFVLERTKVFPSFTQFNQSLTIKDQYNILIYGKSSDGSVKDVPVVAVELS